MSHKFEFLARSKGFSVIFMSKKEKMKKSKIVGQMTVFPFYRSKRYFFD